MSAELPFPRLDESQLIPAVNLGSSRAWDWGADIRVPDLGNIRLVPVWERGDSTDTNPHPNQGLNVGLPLIQKAIDNKVTGDASPRDHVTSDLLTVLDNALMYGNDKAITAHVRSALDLHLEKRIVELAESTKKMDQAISRHGLYVVAKKRNTHFRAPDNHPETPYAARLDSMVSWRDGDDLHTEPIIDTLEGVGLLPEGFLLPRGVYAKPRPSKKR